MISRETFKVNLLHETSTKELYQNRINEYCTNVVLKSTVNSKWQCKNKEIIIKAANKSLDKRKTYYKREGLIFWNNGRKET
jgi:hypothetical protein